MNYKKLLKIGDLFTPMDNVLIQAWDLNWTCPMRLDLKHDRFYMILSYQKVTTQILDEYRVFKGIEILDLTSYDKFIVALSDDFNNSDYKRYFKTIDSIQRNLYLK
jgi:hypothetical protein